MADKRTTPKIEVRTAEKSDVAAIIALSAKVFRDEPAYTRGMILGQLSAFPEGQFVVSYEGEIVGYASTMILPEDKALGQHTWGEVTGGGYAAMHDRKGDWLYGTEICVDPDRRRLRIGKRLYDARRRLCQDLDLKGIAFGGRMPGYRRNARRFVLARGLSGGGEGERDQGPGGLLPPQCRIRTEGPPQGLLSERRRLGRLRRPDDLAQPVL